MSDPIDPETFTGIQATGLGGRTYLSTDLPPVIQLTCANCRYWIPDDPSVEPQREYGRCRRHAPAMGHPDTMHDFWCGEWDRQIIHGKAGLWDPHGVHTSVEKLWPDGTMGRYVEPPKREAT